MADMNGVIFFCDDIREEVNGKVTYMGSYGSEVHVSELPSIIPRMAAVFLARIRGAEEVNVNVEAEIIGVEDGLPVIRHQAPYKKPADATGDEWTLRLNLVGPIPAAEGSTWRVKCSAGDFEAESRLKFKVAPPQPI